MGVPDYKAKLTRALASKAHNLGLAKMHSRFAKAVKLLEGNKKHWDQIVKNSREIVAKQAEFEAIRLSHPDKIKKLAAECEKLRDHRKTARARTRQRLTGQHQRDPAGDNRHQSKKDCGEDFTVLHGGSARLGLIRLTHKRGARALIYRKRASGAPVAGMVDAVGPGDVGEIARVDTVEAADVHATFGRVRPALVVDVAATGRAEPMLGRMRVPCVEPQVIAARQHPDAVGGGGDRAGATPSADRTVAAPCRGQPLGQPSLDFHRPAMAAGARKSRGRVQVAHLRRTLGMRLLAISYSASGCGGWPWVRFQ